MSDEPKVLHRLRMFDREHRIVESESGAPQLQRMLMVGEHPNLTSNTFATVLYVQDEVVAELARLAALVSEQERLSSSLVSALHTEHARQPPHLVLTCPTCALLASAAVSAVDRRHRAGAIRESGPTR